MNKRIKIKDQINRHFLSVTLEQLLNDIAPFSEGLEWALYELDASVKPGGIPGYAKLIDTIDESSTGYPIDRVKLKKLAHGLHQVINLILVATEQKDNFVPYNDTNEWRSRYKFCIEILDGDYWEVYSSDEKFISFLENKYNDTEVAELK